MAGRVVVTSRISEWADKQERLADTVALALATDIDRQSAQLAPKLTRALVNSKRITRKGEANYVVSYGNAAVRYARRRHFENKKNPQTKEYLKRAGDNVKRSALGTIRRIMG